MRHAFLVIAHNNFGVLQRIVSLMDSEGFDFFIHFDRKVKRLPEIHAEHSRIFVCKCRVDVRWGDVSQIECELTLLDYALGAGLPYDYYHFISGTHRPLMTPQEFDARFAGKPAAAFQLMETSEYEIDMKLHRWNLCTRFFKNPSAFVERTSQLIWRLGIFAQRILGIRRFKEDKFIKTCQWCSLSAEAAEFLRSRRKQILKKYRWSFCGDEFFAASEIYGRFLDKVVYWDDCLYQRFKKTRPIVLSEEDLPLTKGYMWARKFED